MNESSPAEITTRLCTACTLCCNGVLFADVRLQPGDDAIRLKELGVPLSAAAHSRFRQPCSCLKESVCGIYGERPNRCRAFECRMLQRALRGELKEAAALQSIGQARQQVERVRSILQELGDVEESVPLSRRYQRMMRQPIDLSAPRRTVALRGKLMKAVAALAGVLERHFLK